MMEENLEAKIQKTERKLHELSLHLQFFNADYEKILEELTLTPEQIKEFAENPDNFSSSLWEKLQSEKREWEEKLKIALDNVPNANQTKQSLAEKAKVRPHWLFVR